MVVRIPDYLLQHKLESALRQIVGDENWLGREVRVPKGRQRWDMAFLKDGQTHVVEFDGDTHYCQSLTIRSDEAKDAIANELGYRVVRFPYWVQLTSQTLEHYFALSAEISQDFPHGFIKTKAFPASFCELGLQRFRRELVALPLNVAHAVRRSLSDRATEFGARYVLPTVELE